MFDNSTNAAAPATHAPCGRRIEDDGFVTVYPDTQRRETVSQEIEDELPTP
jgi:hypothetical protein